MNDMVTVAVDSALGQSSGAVPSSAGRLAHLGELARSLSAAHHIPDVVRVGALVAESALQAAFVSVARLEAGHGTVTVLLDSGDLRRPRNGGANPASQRLSSHAFLRAFVGDSDPWRYVAGQVSRDDELECLLASSASSACMVNRIMVGGCVWGGLYVARGCGAAPFSDEDTEFATALAAVFGAGLAHVERAETLALLAQTDPMTGLANRRGADDALDVALAAHRDHRTPVAVVLCDVNGLKRVNDTFGHPAGDLVLTRVSALLSVAAAEVPGSTAARVGGDEFCLVLPGVSLANATETVERLSDASRSLPFGAGISCGVASAEACAASGVKVTAKQLFRLADAAQYRAKRAGGVRVAVIGPEDVIRVGQPVTGVPWSAGLPHGLPASPDSLGECVWALTAALNRAADLSPLDRLIVLAETAGGWWRAAGWAVSTVDPGAPVLLTRATAAARTGADGVVARKLAQAGFTFPLNACALTAAAVRGGCFHVELGDETANPGALAVLAEAGYTGMIGAGAMDPETGGAWFVEMYSDAFTRLPDGADEPALASTLRALVALALHPGTA
jgi:diguanylate cyclase (GGDEF)-like protein